MTSIKKIVLGIIIAAIILLAGGIVLAGIGLYSLDQESTPHKEDSEVTKTKPVTEQGKELLLNVGETAKSSRLQVTVLSAQKIKTYNYYSEIFETNQQKNASPDNIFVLISVEIQNIGSDREFTGYSKFHMIDSNGFKYDPELYLGTDNLELLKELFQNQKVNGKMIFQVPESAKGLKLQYDFGDIIVGTKLATWII